MPEETTMFTRENIYVLIITEWQQEYQKHGSYKT